VRTAGIEDGSLVKRFLNWKMVLLFWLLYAVLITLPGLVTYPLSLSSLSLTYSVSCVFLIAFVRALFTPLVLAMQARFLISGRRWIPHLLLHILASGLFALAVETLYLVLYRAFLSDEGLSFFDHLILYNDYYFGTETSVYWCITLAYHCLAYLDRYRHGKLVALEFKEKLTSARLETLRAQLQPHFLFNALHTVGGLIRLGRKEQALNTLQDLSDLFRYSLDHGNRAFVPLSDELAFVRMYLGIEEKRFPDRIKVTYSIEPDTERLAVPSLLLQPLVENAVKHGTGGAPEVSGLKISARRDNDHLWIEIRDDGPGLPDGWDEDGSEGMGLKNTRARLDQIYDGEYALNFENRVPHGLSVRIRIPCRSAGRASDE
jgi:signal transduction histidine kinase